MSIEDLNGPPCECEQLRAELARVTAGRRELEQERDTANMFANSALDNGDVLKASVVTRHAESATPALKPEGALHEEYEDLCTKLDTKNWTAGDHSNHFAFFAHGWYRRESATPGLRTDNPLAEPVMGGLPRYDGGKLATPQATPR